MNVAGHWLDFLRALRLDEPAWPLFISTIGLMLGLVAARWMTGMASARKRSAVATRTLLFALIGALLGGATAVRLSDRVASIVVLDVSGSMRRFATLGESAVQARSTVDSVARAVDRFSVGRKPDDLLGVIYVDSRAQPVRAPSTGSVGELPTPVGDDEGTNLEQSLQLAAAMIPPGAAGRVLLISDGNQTVGDALAAASQLAGRGGSRRSRVPIDVLPVSYAVSGESFVQSVDAPPVAPAGATVTVRVVIESSQDVSGQLRLARNGQPVDINGDEPGFARVLRVRAGRHVEAIPVELKDGRTHRFEALWDPDAGPGGAPADRVAANNVGTAFTATPGRGRVLIVTGEDPARDADNAIAPLAQTLNAAGIETQTLAPEAVRADLLWLQAFDLVILQNVAADAVPEGVQRALSTFVAELGGGLVMVGGNASFGAGGWKGSPIEPILPVVLDLPERLVTPASAVILIIDNSGSMNRSVLGSDRSQQDIANDGAALAIESLDRSDLVGVIVFNSKHDVLVPLGPNKHAKASAERVRGISADGGTNLPPALREALESLRRVKADAKHIVVLSDGVSMNKPQIPKIIQEMKASGISVTTIGVGDAADTALLSSMARDGGGAFYRVIDPTLLPRIFVKAVRVLRTPAVREGEFTPVILPSGSPVLDGLADLPPLGGLTLTQPRREPTVINLLATSQGEPVLASWSVGLGRVAAFTSDAGRWASRWIGTPTYTRFWTQLARTTARPASQRNHQLSSEVVGDRLLIRLEETDDQGGPIDGLSIPAAVYAPDGTRTSLQLTQVGPGEYEAQAPATSSGAYVVTLMPREAGRALSPIVAGVSKPGGAEFRAMRSNSALFEQIAEVSGGRVLQLPSSEESPEGLTASSLFTRAGLDPVEARVPLWRWLLIGAIGVLLLDVATRRVAWDRLISPEFGADARREVIAATRDRGAQAAAAIGRLRREQSQQHLPHEHAAIRTLDEQDAAAVIQAERRRRRETADAPRASGAPVIEVPGPGTPRDQPAEGPSSLRAAKRRAQQRFDESSEG